MDRPWGIDGERDLGQIVGRLRSRFGSCPTDLARGMGSRSFVQIRMRFLLSARQPNDRVVRAPALKIMLDPVP